MTIALLNTTGLNINGRELLICTTQNENLVLYKIPIQNDPPLVVKSSYYLTIGQSDKE